MTAVAPSLADLTGRFPQPGRLDWIGLRPARRVEMTAPGAAEIAAEGLVGDRQARANARAVTLIQAEHLPVIAALAGRQQVVPELLRRNLAVSGINLAALRGRAILVGSAVLRLTGPCAPCSRMEAALGAGGYNAMRGHGGWTAEVLRPGLVRLGDPVVPEP